MKMFSSCSGECCLCSAGRACLAGHGDDDFYPATKDQLIERLIIGEYPSYTDMMKEYLLKVYNYDYDKESPKVIPKDPISRKESLRTIEVNGIILVYKEYE